MIEGRERGERAFIIGLFFFFFDFPYKTCGNLKEAAQLHRGTLGANFRCLISFVHMHGFMYSTFPLISRTERYLISR